MATDILNFSAEVELGTKTAHKQLQKLAEFMQQIFGKSVDLGDSVVDLEKIATTARKAGSSTQELQGEWQGLLSVIKQFGGSLGALEDMSSISMRIRDNMGVLRAITQSYNEETADFKQNVYVYEQQANILSQIVTTSKELEQAQRQMNSAAKKYGEDSKAYEEAANSAKYYDDVLKDLIATAQKADFGQSEKFNKTVGKIGHKQDYNAAVVADEEKVRLTKEYTTLVSKLWKEEEKLAKLRAQKSNTKEIQAEKEYKDILAQEVTEFEQKNQVVVEGVKDTQEYNNALAQHNSIMRQTQAHYEKTTTILGKVKANFKSIFAGVLEAGLSWKIFAAGTSALKSSIETIKELDKAVTDLRIATGYTQEQVRSMVVEYNKMAQDLGATTTQVTESADTWLKF